MNFSGITCFIKGKISLKIVECVPRPWTIVVFVGYLDRKTCDSTSRTNLCPLPLSNTGSSECTVSHLSASTYGSTTTFAKVHHVFGTSQSTQPGLLQKGCLKRQRMNTVHADRPENYIYTLIFSNIISKWVFKLYFDNQKTSFCNNLYCSTCLWAW